MTTPIVFAQKVFQVPTPRHASQTPDEIRNAFVKMIATNAATRSQIRQAALGQTLLVVNPSTNPNANYVFYTVLEAMIASIQQSAAAKAEQTANTAPAPGVTEVEGPGDDIAEMEEAFA